MQLDIELIVDYIKLFITNMYVYYCFEKLLAIKDNRLRNYLILFGVNIILLIIYINIKMLFNSLLPFIIMVVLYTAVLSVITKNKFGYSIIVTLISYAILLICHITSIVMQFIPYKILYKLFNKENIYLNLIIISSIQFALVYCFFKIKKFKNGLAFLKNKFNNEITDIIMINISILVVILYSLTGIYENEITRNFLLTLFVLGITMFFTIQKMLTMYYKQKLLMDTMDEYKAELTEKQNEIERLKNDKKNVSRITHEFYNRQKALELLVTSNLNTNNIDKENISPNVLKIIESLTNEYSGRFEEIKELPKLDKTEIPEIDNMFKYMQSECDKNNINFKLKTVGNIHTLVNNIISKNKLETLIGDHLRDAINAVNLTEESDKEIFAILGVKNKKYEFSIYDTGINFEIETLLKLGLEPVTTNADRGGTGTGFMTTFDTLNETGASLIITEYPLKNGMNYTKCVTIRFDGKKQYKICTYRCSKIRKLIKDNRIKIEEYRK